MRFTLTSHVRWSSPISTAMGLLAVGAFSFVGLAVGVSPYALVALLLLACGVVARRATLGAVPAIRESEAVTRAYATVEETIAALPVTDLSVLLHTIALQAQVLTGARYVALGIGTDPDKPFDPWITLGMEPEVARSIGRHPRPVGVLGRVALDGQVVRMPDIRSHPSYRGLPAGHPPVSSFLGVPIRYRGRPAGNLYLADKQGATQFSDRDERMVLMLASRAALAIETARLYRGEEQGYTWLLNTIDQMPEGVLLLDREGRTVAMNRALQAFLREHGPDLASFGDSKAFDVRFPEGGRMPVESLPSERALRHGELTTGKELVVCLGDGRLVPILANAAPVRDERGQISGATLIVQDITAIKDLERLREEWTTVVAHDLRQPLGVIALSAEGMGRLLPSDTPESARRALDRIHRAAQRLDRMIDDLLDASLLESKRLTVECRSVDLGALLHAVKEELDGAAKGHDLRIDVPSGPLLCWLDADRVRQVLQNLISNAAKYGRPGSEIRVAVVGRAADVEVAVTNEGPGIARESLPELFSRFMRTPEARAGRAPGLGLGLYITKGLIEAHGGRIWAESQPGAWTTFRFTLPRARAGEGLPAASGRL